jgi:glycosyltransferase involved in cell wall biosynthesis
LGYNINKPYILYVGNVYPHKNLESLVECFQELRKDRPDLRLVLVGKEDYFYERLKRLAEANKLWLERDSQSPIIFAGYVPDAELEILFQKATVYVFPSLYEGFGLPPLEAMAHGCPVASSDKASMPEILGEAAAYFDPEKPGDMAAVLKRILDDQTERQSLMARGYEQIKKYSWSECANLTWQIYQEILKLKVSNVSPKK